MQDPLLASSSTSRRQKDPPLFFIPSTGTSPAVSHHLPQPQSHLSFTPLSPTSAPSLPPHPYPSVTAPTTPRPRSRQDVDTSQSLSRLRSALEAYSPGTSSASVSARQGKLAVGKGEEVARREEILMEGLIEIHNVLYKGDGQQGRDGWRVDTAEVERVIDKWFERDCIYDHPLLRIGSRQNLHAHFALLHLLSTGFIPSLTPKAISHHARDTASFLISRILGEMCKEDVKDVEAGKLEKGKDKALGPSVEIIDRFDRGGMESGSVDEKDEKETRKGSEGWWRLWDVRADCKEIGTMECYDGYHLAMIEQVITLTLLPTLARPRSVTSLLHSPSSTSITSYENVSQCRDPPSSSYPRRLITALANEFDYFLHWDLPISTLVAFNEVGRATYVKDVVDIRDAIETFVPLAGRIGWLTRRVTGSISASIGGMVMALLPAPVQDIKQPIKVAVQSGATVKANEAKSGLIYGCNDKDVFSLARAPAVVDVFSPGSIPNSDTLSDESLPNILGLRGVSTGEPEPSLGMQGMAPDCDNGPEI